MSIAKRQMIAVADKIIGDSFRNGVILTIDQLVAKVNEAFGESKPGFPITRYREATSRGRSNPEDWNSTIEEIDTDLNVLYDENVEQMQRILADFDYFEVEKRKLERNIIELEDKIEELLLLNNNVDGYLYSAYEQFRNLNQIDLTGTTAWVDLQLGHATLPQAKTGNVKLDLINQEISGELLTQDNVVTTTTIEPLSNILDDNLNTSWIQKVVTDKQIEVRYQVYVKLNGDEVTRFIIYPHVSGKTNFEVRYTEDEMNWKVMGSNLGQDSMAFDFSQAWFKGLRIVMSKSQHDETETGPNGEQYYVYYFGITNISLLKLGFETEAVLQSLPLPIKDRQGNAVQIDKVSIEVTDDTPTGTEINYYIALQKSDGEVLEWQPITPYNKEGYQYPKVINLKSMSSTYPVAGLLASGATQYVEGSTSYFNGLQFWCLNALGTIPADYKILYNSNSPQLYKGIGQFRQEAYYLNIAAGPELHMPSTADWIQFPTDGSTNLPVPVATKYINVASNFSLPSQENMYSYRFTTSLYFNRAKDIQSTLTITSNNSAAKLNVYIMVNGLPINQGDSLTTTNSLDVTWPFTDGWNVVQIMLYKPDGYSTTLNLCGNGQINPFTATNKVRVDQEPMVYVPLFDYLYNVFEKETDKFSLTDDNRVLIGDYQKRQGARYDFYYNYTIDQGYANIVRVKAELTRGDDPSVTPKVIYYKVRVT